MREWEVVEVKVDQESIACIDRLELERRIEQELQDPLSSGRAQRDAGLGTKPHPRGIEHGGEAWIGEGDACYRTRGKLLCIRERPQEPRRRDERPVCIATLQCSSDGQRLPAHHRKDTLENSVVPR